MALLLVGTSHHRASVELREQVAFDLDGAREIAARLAGDGGEAVALSTCNRTELYLVADDDAAGGRARAVEELRRVGDLPAGSSSRRSTPSRAPPPPSISSASPPGSTRSSPGRRRSSGRCGPPTRRA
jgi:hypothetical protein